MKAALLIPLLTACQAEAEAPPPSSWLDFANRNIGWVFLLIILWVINR